ncbi:MAG: MotA/TolQ/ExbB proton channel family protein [Methylobacter sp.]|nr:MotA/TolQ/ExbB proton channel family protein [Methylobacter sp.]MDP2098078.1 MotA/TolQ/ExbB proton channel family protein [Methylobacter sp.]MDP2430078.1 MotA/TolQ/ExbB proton channel family protein [Methylobacter sp.]MDP3056893.1 MotA/TolQ/ExbB proton channel family protein [Methylobacter sp.]MDP3364388.1 MotA/TolQ/ExbB proton channel family protein [Methylobacter sp.]
MDIASLVGFFLGVGIIAAAIVTGGDIMLFVDIPSVMVVFGGTFGVSLMRIPISELSRSFKVLGKAFFNKREDPQLLIQDAIRLSGVARKTGLLALDNEEIANPFLKKGISLCVDGHDPELVRKMLTKEIDQMVARNESGQSLWQGVANLAPAMGMIGTLIGLVQMLANMSDPSSIGPAMAIALITTLYGAIIANCFAIPIVDKLATVLEYERTNMELIIEIINGIQEGMNPKILETVLTAYISNHKRKKEDE